jgi:23S rRNA (pseudouridine1915-N3)-methyltransferase
MKITLLCLGRNKESHIRAATEEYLKRISPFTDIEPVYLPDRPLSGTNSQELVIRQEGERICKYLDEKQKSHNRPPFIIVLDAGGKMLSSEELAVFLEDRLQQRDLILIIGGVYGLAAEVKKRADMQLSLSKMTFTHQMARVIILEQIYRAFTINRGKKYHY